LADGGERDDEAIELGRCSRVEHELILRGLDCLKKMLLEEAGEFAMTKLSLRRESLANVAAEGRKRVEQVEIASRLQGRLRAVGTTPQR
jgi:hypothetical protein